MTTQAEAATAHALKLLALALEGEPDPEPVRLLVCYDLARIEVGAAEPHARLAVDLLAAVPGPAGTVLRVDRFKAIVAELRRRSDAGRDQLRVPGRLTEGT